MNGALEGIKVIDVSTMAAVPIAARLLGDWGADVIHVEHPTDGDPWRTWLQQAEWTQNPEVDYQYWEHYNRNKRSITLDLSREPGREVLYKMIEGADVFLSNLRPYELEKFSLDYDSLSRLNPKLICANLTGCGKEGPDKNEPGHDTVMFWVRSGITYQMERAEVPPLSQGVRILACGDKLTGLGLAGGIALALFVRERTGIGQEVNMSLLQTGIFANVSVALALASETETLGRDEEGNPRHKAEIPALVNSYKTKDGRWVQLCLAPSDTYWSGLCQAIEREQLEHDPRFESFEERAENQADLYQLLGEVFLTRTMAEWKIRLTETGMLWAPVQSPHDVVADPQVRASGVFVPFDHPTFGRINVLANPISLSKTPATLRTPAPEFGQHTEEVLLEHGYSWDDIVQLKEQDIIA